MTPEMLAKIKQWISDNHQHHLDDYGRQDVYTATCPVGDCPYVNSLELEKFLEGLVDKKPRRKRPIIVQKNMSRKG